MLPELDLGSVGSEADTVWWRVRGSFMRKEHEIKSALSSTRPWKDPDAYAVTFVANLPLILVMVVVMERER